MKEKITIQNISEAERKLKRDLQEYDIPDGVIRHFVEGRLEEVEDMSYDKVRNFFKDDLKRNHNNGFYFYCKEKDFQKSERYFREAFELDSNDFTANYLLGSSLEMQKKYPEAEEYYRRAVKIQPNHLQANLDLGSCLESQNKHSEAELYVRKAIHLDPNNFGANYFMGTLFFSKNEAQFRRLKQNLDNRLKESDELTCSRFGARSIGYQEAMEIKETTIKLKNSSFEIDNFIKERTHNALPYFRKAVKIKPDDINALDKLIVCLNILGDKKSADFFTGKLNELLVGGEKTKVAVTGDYVARDKIIDRSKKFDTKDSVLHRSQIGGASGLSNNDRLQLLEDRFLKGEISEEIYKRLRRKYEVV